MYDLRQNWPFADMLIARLESTAADAKISTVDRYMESLGYVVQYHLIPTDVGGDKPAVVVH